MKWINGLGLALAIAAASWGGSATPASAGGDGGAHIVWSGLYVGGHLGGAWADAKALDVIAPAGGIFTPIGPQGGQGFEFSPSGVAGGGQLGLQHQFGHWVLGAEVAVTWADLQQTIASPYGATARFAAQNETIKIDPILTVTARAGYAWDRWMVYAKAGYAGADIQFRAYDAAYQGNRQVGLTLDSWHNGYAVGAGVDYALTEGIRIGLDYTFVDLQSKTKLEFNTGWGPEVFKIDPEGIHALSARLSFLIGRQEQTYEPMK